jgi:hypothetical protein
MDRPIGAIYALTQRKQWGMLARVCTESCRRGGKPGHEGIGGHAARNLAGAMPSHAVCQCDNAMDRVDRNAVFVVLADVTHVR